MADVIQLTWRPSLWPSLRTSSRILAPVATVLPILNILHLVTTLGVDTLSSDLIKHVPVVTRILNGPYLWHNFLRDTFYNGHLMVFPTLLRLMLARVAYWNVYVELFIGLGAMVLVLFVAHNALTARTRHPLRLWMWPALSILLFSPAHINQFTFSDAAIPMGFSALGLCLVLWSLVRFRQQWKAVLLGGAAAWFASWSWAQGALAWPLLIGSMRAVNFWAWRTQKHRQHGATDVCPLRYTASQFMAVVIAAILSLAPYAAFMLLSPPGRLERPLSLLNLVFIVNAIGFPFVNEPGSNILLARVRPALGMSGIEALVFTTGMIYLLARKRPSLWRAAAPGFYLAAAGLLSVWQLSIFRRGLSIWYTGIGVSFWLGIFGLAYTLLTNTAVSGIRRPTVLLAQRVATLIIIAAVTASLLFNLRYDRKVYFLESRAPVSASCLRNQRNAPTYCEPRVFFVEPPIAGSLYAFADQLKSQQLSVFAPNQRWTLQGDFALNTVNVRESPGSTGVRWMDGQVNGQTPNRAPWYDYRHLDLRLPSTDSLTWTFYLPRTTRRAIFHTEVAALTAAPANSKSRHISAFLYAQVGQSPQSLLVAKSLQVGAGRRDWQPIDISLLPYTGQTVTLQFASSPSPDSQDVDQLLFRYPYIDVLLDDDPATAEESQRVATVRPEPDEGDQVFSVDNTARWEMHGLHRTDTDDGPAWLITGTDARLTYTHPLSACLADYTHLYMRVAAEPSISPRVLQWFYRLDGAPVTEHSPSVQLPLLPDGEMHEYTYPLRLLELDQTAHLTGFTLKLQRLSLEAVGDEIRIDDMRLLRQNDESHCR